MKKYLRLLFTSFLLLSASIVSATLPLPIIEPDLSPATGFNSTYFDVYVKGTGTMYYTLDGVTAPDQSAWQVPTNGLVRITKNQTLQVQAWSPEGNSLVATANYDVTGAIYAGGAHILALNSVGYLVGWGSQNTGRLGNGQTSGNVTLGTKVEPTDLTGSFSNTVDASAGFNHSLVVLRDGRLYSFGENGNGQLGNNSTNDAAFGIPVQKQDGSSLTNIYQVAAGYNFSLALDKDGRVWSFGLQTNGRLGNGLTGSGNQKYASEVLAQSSGLFSVAKITKIAAGKNFGMALDTNGNVWMWGENGSGQLGINSTTSYGFAQKVQTSGSSGNDLANIVDISAGYEHAVALQDVSGITKVFCWGSQRDGRLGNGVSSTTPLKNASSLGQVKVGSSTYLQNVLQICAGPRHTLALESNGEVVSWGYNADGNLGNNSTTSSSYAIKVKNSNNTNLTEIKYIAAGGFESTSGSPAVTTVYSTSFAINNVGTAFSWGDNGYNILARASDATTKKRAQPLEIPSLCLSYGSDMDGDGMADEREARFGLQLGGVNDSQDDSDGDGDINFDELNAQTPTNPREYALAIFGGNNQSKPANSILPNYLEVKVTNRAVLNNAVIGEPVVFKVLSGGGKLERPGDLAFVDEVTVNTGGSGAYAGIARLRYKQSPHGSTTSQISATIGFSNAPAVIFTAYTDHLVGKYSMDEMSGALMAEESGTNYHGTKDLTINGVTGGEKIEGQNAFHFNGGTGTNYAQVPSSCFQNDPTKPFTISMWIKPSAVVSGAKASVLAYKEQYLTSGFRLAIDNNYMFPSSNWPSDGKMRVCFWTGQSGGNPDIALIPYVGIDPDEWHHVAVTYNQTGAKLYVDGVMIAEDNGVLITNDRPMRLGHNFGDSNNFKGLMDDVRIFSKVLSVSEIAGLLNEVALPMTFDQSVTTKEDERKTIILQNTGNSLPQILTYPNPQTEGTLIGAGKAWVFRPVADFNGSCSFTYKDGSSNTSTVSITVTPVDDKPTPEYEKTLVIHKKWSHGAAPKTFTMKLRNPDNYIIQYGRNTVSAPDTPVYEYSDTNNVREYDLYKDSYYKSGLYDVCDGISSVVTTDMNGNNICNVTFEASEFKGGVYLRVPFQYRKSLSAAWNFGGYIEQRIDVVEPVYITAKMGGSGNGSGNSPNDRMDASNYVEYTKIITTKNDYHAFYYEAGTYETNGLYLGENYWVDDTTRVTANWGCKHYGTGTVDDAINEPTIIKAVKNYALNGEGGIFCSHPVNQVFSLGSPGNKKQSTTDGFEVHDMILDANAEGQPGYKLGEHKITSDLGSSKLISKVVIKWAGELTDPEKTSTRGSYDGYAREYKLEYHKTSAPSAWEIIRETPATTSYDEGENGGEDIYILDPPVLMDKLILTMKKVGFDCNRFAIKEFEVWDTTQTNVAVEDPEVTFSFDATADKIMQETLASSAILTCITANVTDGDTVTIGSKTYTFKNTLSAEGHVKIGSDANASLLNLIRAINRWGTPNTDYQIAAAHPGVSANESVEDHSIVVVSNDNSPTPQIVNTSSTTNLSWNGRENVPPIVLPDGVAAGALRGSSTQYRWDSGRALINDGDDTTEWSSRERYGRPGVVNIYVGNNIVMEGLKLINYGATYAESFPFWIGSSQYLNASYGGSYDAENLRLNKNIIVEDCQFTQPAYGNLVNFYLMSILAQKIHFQDTENAVVRNCSFIDATADSKGSIAGWAPLWENNYCENLTMGVYQEAGSPIVDNMEAVIRNNTFKDVKFPFSIFLHYGSTIGKHTFEDNEVIMSDWVVGNPILETSLDDLRNGKGISIEEEVSKHLRVTSRDGTHFDVDLRGANDVEDVKTIINAAATAAYGTPANIIANFESVGNSGKSLKLTDTRIGTGNLKVEALDSSKAAFHLGILKTAANSNKGEIFGDNLAAEGTVLNPYEAPLRTMVMINNNSYDHPGGLNHTTIDGLVVKGNVMRFTGAGNVDRSRLLGIHATSITTVPEYTTYTLGNLAELECVDNIFAIDSGKEFEASPGSDPDAIVAFYNNINAWGEELTDKFTNEIAQPMGYFAQ